MTKKNVTIISSPHERPKGQVINNVPKTVESFYEIINNGSWEELKAYGFRKWNSMSNLIRENVATKGESKSFVIPVFNAGSAEEAAKIISGVLDGDIVKSDQSMLMDFGPKVPVPIVQLKQDEDVILFPGEWYNIIPDGFKYTGLYGQEEIFKKDKTDDDIRFGCLAYGIRRPVVTPQP